MDPTLLARGAVLGFTIAAAVGPISLLCIRRTLAEGRLVGLASGLGVATADATYGAIAAFGLTAVTDLLLDGRRILGVVGGAFLLWLAWRTFRAVPGEAIAANASARRAGLPGAYLSMLGLTLANPMTILSFAALFVGLGVTGRDPAGAALLTAGVFVGSAAWWVVLVTVVGALRSRVTVEGLRVVNMASAVLIGAFAIVALASAVAGAPAERPALGMVPLRPTASGHNGPAGAQVAPALRGLRRSSVAIHPEPPTTLRQRPATEGGERSRRSLLAAMVGGLAGLAASALGRPADVRAAAGSTLIIGSLTNNAGTSNTRLTTSSTGSAWDVVQSGTGTAMRSSANNGIAGYFGSTNGTGVSGVVGNNTKYGVYGANNGASYAGGAALRADGKKNHGIVATSNDPQGIPVRALHQGVAGLGLAIKGESTATAGIGVHGLSNTGGSPFDSDPIGVLGETTSVFGTGVLGRVTLNPGDSGGYALKGEAPAGTGCLVLGGQYGLYASSSSYGIYAQGSIYAAYFQGDAHVNGTLSKTGGMFKIDHPLDPANKYLQHSFVESPDMKNVYDGVVDLDDEGRAVVEMPDWFGALNRDFRYQLTSIGGRAQAWIADEIVDGRFTIASDRPKARISWQVTGIRQDAWAKVHPIAVEEAKKGPERGRYLHPLEHGRPAKDGMQELFTPKEHRG